MDAVRHASGPICLAVGAHRRVHASMEGGISAIVCFGGGRFGSPTIRGGGGDGTERIGGTKVMSSFGIFLLLFGCGRRVMARRTGDAAVGIGGESLHRLMIGTALDSAVLVVACFHDIRVQVQYAFSFCLDQQHKSKFNTCNNNKDISPYCPSLFVFRRRHKKQARMRDGRFQLTCACAGFALKRCAGFDLVVPLKDTG